MSGADTIFRPGRSSLTKAALRALYVKWQLIRLTSTPRRSDRPLGWCASVHIPSRRIRDLLGFPAHYTSARQPAHTTAVAEPVFQAAIPLPGDPPPLHNPMWRTEMCQLRDIVVLRQQVRQI
jgi:hypothetical protein